MDFRMDTFTVSVTVLLLILGAILLVQQPVEQVPGEAEYLFFYLPSCPHCHEQMDFHKQLTKEFPDVEITSYDVSTPSGRNAYLHFVGPEIRTPVTIIGNTTITGFGSAETTGQDIRQALRGEVVVQEEPVQTVFGKDISTFSLPVLAVALGFLDGFNPCAMWMLVYLLGLVAGITSKRRRWLIVGIFLAASAILYFLFMTAWLNMFLLIGILRPVQIAIGLFAIGFGIIHVRDWLKEDAATCKIDSKRSKKYEKAKDIVKKPLSIGVILGLIGLAFAVNSVEFLCSAGIPAVFTGVLALNEISLAYQYGLIAVYVLLYMIDDLIIFLLAMFAIDKYVSDSYMRHTKILTGILMLILGFLIAFMPHVLF